MLPYDMCEFLLTRNPDIYRENLYKGPHGHNTFHFTDWKYQQRSSSSRKKEAFLLIAL